MILSVGPTAPRGVHVGLGGAGAVDCAGAAIFHIPVHLPGHGVDDPARAIARSVFIICSLIGTFDVMTRGYMYYFHYIHDCIIVMRLVCAATPLRFIIH